METQRVPSREVLLECLQVQASHHPEVDLPGVGRREVAFRQEERPLVQALLQEQQQQVGSRLHPWVVG